MNALTNRIAFQGDFGANSDMACRDMFPTMEPLPCPTFEDAFQALENGDADLAMIPIENTIAGRVADIHHLLPESRLHIIGEYFMPIRFQLMVLPGVTREEIRTVHSHIHALGQCRKIIRSNGWKAVVAGDTAGSAKMVAEKGDRTMAALAPRLAADLYGLEILAENVEDRDDNVTRFVVLSRDEKWVQRNNPDEVLVTTFVFNVRNIPAALYKAMGGFATNGINMTKLESYHSAASSWPPSSTRISKAIQTTRRCAGRWKSCVSSRRRSGFSVRIRATRCEALCRRGKRRWA